MRYGANLLFEYGVGGHPQARPLCEKRIVLIEARGPQEAVRRARKYGKRQELSYRNADGKRFHIKFLGLVDVIALDDSNHREVYYSMFRTARPQRHVQSEDKLSVFQSGPASIRSAWWAVPASEARSSRKRRGRKRGRPLK